MAKDVTCKVGECRYYSAGDICNAKNIEVEHDAAACQCSSSCDTICKTFQPK